MASDMKKLWFIKESFVGRVCCDVKFCIEWLFRAVCCYSSSWEYSKRAVRARALWGMQFIFEIGVKQWLLSLGGEKQVLGEKLVVCILSG